MRFIKIFIASVLSLSATQHIYFHYKSHYETTHIQSNIITEKTKPNINEKRFSSLTKAEENIHAEFNKNLEKNNFSRAFFIAMNSSSELQKEKLLTLLFSRWVQIDPSDHVIPFISLLDEEYTREYLYIYVFDAWLKWNTHEFNAWLIEQKSNADFDLAIESIIRNHETEDFVFSIISNWATRINSPKKRSKNIEFIIENWSHYNLEETIVWIEKNPSNQKHLPYLFQVLTKRDIGEALIALELLESKNKQLATESLFTVYNATSEQLSYDKINELLNAVNFLSSDGLKEQVYELFLPKILLNDVSQITQVIDSIGNEDSRKSLQRRVVSSWANINPQTAIDYINTLSEDEGNSTIINDVISNWKDGDIFAADQWLSSLNYGSNIDSAAAALAVAASVNEHTIHISLKWLSKIHDPIVKKDTILDVFSWWNDYDSASALSYLNATTASVN